MTEDEYIESNHKIQSLFFREFGPFSGKVIHSFLPVKKRNEVDTWPIVIALKKEGATLTIPKADLNSLQLTHHIYDSQTRLEENAWGVPEPDCAEEVNPHEIDLVLLPLLAFDERGYRVGYGKGYYDRFLAVCRGDALKVGLSFFPPVHEISDVDRFDVRMDYCITPDKVYRWIRGEDSGVRGQVL